MKHKHEQTDTYIIDAETENKLLIRNLILDMKMPRLDYIERAKMLERALDLEKKAGSKNASSIVAKKIGLSGHKEIYRALTVLSANTTTQRLMQEGKITPEKVARVLYNLKDRTKEDAVIEKIIKKDIPILKAEKLVSEVNDPDLIFKHFIVEIERFQKSMNEYAPKLKSLSEHQKTVSMLKIAGLITTFDNLREKIK
jgi:hypothetical protein